jgi:hypothetical protein
MDRSLIPGLEEALRRLVGQRLASVVFAQDYLQLVWDDASLTVLNPMTVEGPDYILEPDNDLFPKRLVEFITDEPVGAEVTDHEVVRLLFRDGKAISISLRDKDYAGPEALIFRAQGMDVTWVI